MKRTQPKFQTCAKALLLAALPLAVSQALAAEYWLQTGTTTVMGVPMWGYASCTDGTFTSCGAVTVPGPDLSVPVGDNLLTVHLRNTLAQQTSLVIPGQTMANPTPVWTDGTSGPRYASPASPSEAELDKRVRSFTHEAAAGGGEADYVWPNVKPGTYLYQSGTHPQIQVQMGLYGSLVKDAQAGNVAYRQDGTDITYSQQIRLLYSEIDPALHAAVDNQTYGTTGPTSTLDYKPKFFLINGLPYDATTNPGPIASVPAGQNTLLRFLNAGLKTHVPTIQGQYWKMIAEDGNPYPYLSNPRQQYSAFLPAGKTLDVVLTPTGEGTFPIYDSRQFDTNNGVLGGGMLASLAVTPAGAAAPLFDSAPVATGMVGQPYVYNAHATDPNGDVVSYSLNSPVVTGMTINVNSGLINWIPASAGNYMVSVRASDTTLPTAMSSDQNYQVAIVAPPNNQAPTARSDNYVGVAHAPTFGSQSVAVPGVLANDSDPEGQTLTALKLSESTCNNTACASPTNSNRIALNPDGSFTLTSTTNQNRIRATYRITDGTNTSDSTMDISFAANKAPVASADALTVPRCTVRLSSTSTACRITGAGGYIPVLLNLPSNDTDADSLTIDAANQLPLSVARLRATSTSTPIPTSGTLTTSSGGKVTFTGTTATGVKVTYTPPYNFAGTDTFLYRVKDRLGKESGSTNTNTNNLTQGWASVTVTVQ